MRWNNEAVLVVDDDWHDADELRVLIKESGILNVPIAMSEGLVALAREHFAVIFIVMPERIRRNSSNPLQQAVLRHFPSTPVVSVHEHVRRELFFQTILRGPEIQNKLANRPKEDS